MKKYEITEETVNKIANTLFDLNVGAKTLAAIVEALKVTPIEEKPKE